MDWRNFLYIRFAKQVVVRHTTKKKTFQQIINFMTNITTNKDMNWDNFESNYIEMRGPIKKEPIQFEYSKVEVWFNGGCIFKSAIKGNLIGNILNGAIQFSLENNGFEKYITTNFSFEEISTNVNRKIWSKDLMNTKNLKYNDLTPHLVSLFFKNGHLTKVALNIHNQNSMVELYK